MRVKVLLIFSLILFLHIFVLTNLIFFPYPEFFIYPYLTNHGMLPYKQIFDQHFPGLMFFPLNFDNLGMKDAQYARLWLIDVVVLTQTLVFTISWKIFKRAKVAIFASFLYLLWQPFLEGWVLWIDTFLPLFLLPAFYFIYRALEKQSDVCKELLAAGFFLGVALVFKQVVLPLILMVAVLLIWYKRSFRGLAWFIAGLTPAPLFLVFYLLKIGVFPDAWYWTVVFNLTTFAEWGRKYPTFTGLVRGAGVYTPCFLLPLLGQRKLYLTFGVFILGALMAIYARFDFVHFQPSLPFAVIASSALFFRLLRIRVWRFLMAGYALMALMWLIVFYRGHISSKVMFFDEGTMAVSSKIREFTKPREEIFIFGPVPHLYQMSGTLPAGKIFVFQFPWFLRETEDKFLDALKTSPPRLVVQDRTVVIEGNPIVVYAQKLDQFIQTNYTVVERQGNVEFLRRKN